MDLKSEVISHLTDGSVNTPGHIAAEILAASLDADVTEVREVLRQLQEKGQLDTGGRALRNASYIALTVKRGRGPRSKEGRRQQRFAVDQKGNYLSSTATGTRTIERRATLSEWIRFGNPADKYPFNDQPKESVVTTTSTVNPPTAETTPVKALTAPQRKRLENIETTKQLLSAALAKTDTGLVPSVEFIAQTAVELSVSENAMGEYITQLKRDGFCEYVKTEMRGKTYIKLKPVLTYEQKLEAVLDTLRQLAKKRKRASLVSEISKMLGLTENAVSSLMGALRHVHAYETVRLERLGNRKLSYVQATPLSNEQLELCRQWRTQQSKASKKKEPAATTVTDPALEQPQAAPPVTASASAQPTMAELIELLNGVVARNEELTTQVTQLSEENEQLTAELARYVGHNTALQSQLDDLTDRLESSEMQLEFLRTSAASQEPEVPMDLLQRARGIVDKGSSPA